MKRKRIRALLLSTALVITQLPMVIMADDFDAAWDQYMEEYNACNPQIYFDYLQQKVNEN